MLAQESEKFVKNFRAYSSIETMKIYAAILSDASSFILYSNLKIFFLLQIL